MMLKKKIKCNNPQQKCWENDMIIKVILNWKKAKNMFNQNDFHLSYGATDITEITIGMRLCYPRSTK